MDVSIRKAPLNQVKAGVVLNYALIGLNILLGLLYTPYMLRMLGRNEYGLYSLVASIISYLTLFDFGMGTVAVRYAAKYRAEGKAEESKSMFGMFFALHALLGAAAFAAGLCLYFNVGALFDQTMTPVELSRARTMILLLSVNLAVTFPMSVFNSIITAYEEFVFQKALNILRIVLSAAVTVVLLHEGYKAVAMVVVQTVFNLTVLALNAFYCFHKLGIRLAFRKCRPAFVKEVLAFSFWVFLGDIMSRVYWNSGQFVLGAYSGTEAVAVFALAVTLQHMYQTFSVGISSVLLPRVTRICARDNTESQISDLFIRTGRIQYAVLSLLLSGFVLFGRQFIALWAGKGYGQVYALALVFFFTGLAPLLQNTGGAILYARNQMRFRSVMLSCLSAVSLVFQIILTGLYGPAGCAAAIGAALLMGQGVIMNVHYRNKQKIAIGRFWREIARMSVVPALLTAGGWLVLSRFELDSFLKLITAVAVYTVLYIPVFFRLSMNSAERKLFAGIARRLNRVRKKVAEAVCLSLSGNNHF